MKAKFIVSFLYYFSGVNFVVITAATVILLVTSIFNKHEKDKFGFDIGGIDAPFPISIYNRVTTPADVSYASDHSIRYRPVNEYTVEVKPNTALAVYFVIFKVTLLTIAIIGSWFTLKILNEIRVGNPFNFQSVKYLKMIAVMFVSSDIVKFINNLVFNQIIQSSEFHHGFCFPITLSLSDGILLGLVIWIVAIIFQRGVELQNENDLTV